MLSNQSNAVYGRCCSSQDFVPLERSTLSVVRTRTVGSSDEVCIDGIGLTDQWQHSSALPVRNTRPSTPWTLSLCAAILLCEHDDQFVVCAKNGEAFSC
jgi:hypothetical protein